MGMCGMAAACGGMDNSMHAIMREYADNQAASHGSIPIEQCVNPQYEANGKKDERVNEE